MRTYDPQDVSVIVDGTYLTGFADGTFVNSEKTEDNYTTYVGAQGEVSRAKNANPLGQIVVTLQTTSPSNAMLVRLANSKRSFAARVIDRNSGQETVGGSECWIQKTASREWAKEVGTREWTIIVADYAQDFN